MLPYGALRYHGAPAELRDIPIGTVLHGYFLLSPEGDKTFPPPEKGHEKGISQHNHAVTLEDDFSFHERQGAAWKIVSLDTAAGKIKMSCIGNPIADGLKGEQAFDFDGSTRVWKGRQIGTLKDLAREQEVQISLTWTHRALRQTSRVRYNTINHPAGFEAPISGRLSSAQ